MNLITLFQHEHFLSRFQAKNYNEFLFTKNMSRKWIVLLKCILVRSSCSKPVSHVGVEFFVEGLGFTPQSVDVGFECRSVVSIDNVGIDPHFTGIGETF